MYKEKIPLHLYSIGLQSFLWLFSVWNYSHKNVYCSLLQAIKWFSYKL